MLTNIAWMQWGWPRANTPEVEVLLTHRSLLTTHFDSIQQSVFAHLSYFTSYHSPAFSNTPSDAESASPSPPSHS